jgi:DNA-binding NarL/FixJ family response regulator
MLVRPEAEATIAVLLVDGRSLFRQAVGGVLNAVDGLTVAGESHSARQAVHDAERTQPDVVVVDGDLDVAGLADLVVGLKQAAPSCRVLVLATEEQLAPLVDALRAGATGYLTKEASMTELIEAVRRVHRGEFVVPADMLGDLLATLVGQGGRTNDSLKTLSKLTRREREVLSLLADGSNKDAIAEALAISPQTARTHVQNILAKLGLHSRLEAAAFARRHPILKDLVAAD